MYVIAEPLKKKGGGGGVYKITDFVFVFFFKE